jgi:hypothetical protein
LPDVQVMLTEALERLAKACRIHSCDYFCRML